MRVASIYAPNGNPIGTEKFQFKLAFMDKLRAHLQELLLLEERFIIAGDYNVIPREVDCHNPAVWTGDALFQPETRAAYRTLQNLGCATPTCKPMARPTATLLGLPGRRLAERPRHPHRPPAAFAASGGSAGTVEISRMRADWRKPPITCLSPPRSAADGTGEPAHGCQRMPAGTRYTEPEILAPQSGWRNRADTADIEKLAEWLDTKFVIPGTNWRFGLDSIIGLVPASATPPPPCSAPTLSCARANLARRSICKRRWPEILRLTPSSARCLYSAICSTSPSAQTPEICACCCAIWRNSAHAGSILSAGRQILVRRIVFLTPEWHSRRLASG